MSTTPSARQLAWKALLRWSRGGVFAETLVASAAREHRLSTPERALLQAIVYDTLRHLSYLDHLRKSLRSAPLEDSVRWLVLTGLCQLFVQHQAEHAAVNETVSLAPARARGVVNAMLRQALRSKERIVQEKDTLPPAIRFSTPSWLVKRWIKDFGEEETLALLAYNEQTPAVYLRLNPAAATPLTEEPADWESLSDTLPLWRRLNGPLPLNALEAGQVYIADPSTRYCVELLNPQRGERVLDACAAPGGKSAAIIGATGGEVRLLATDGEEHRLAPLRENLRRAGGKEVQVLGHDWTQPCPDAWRGTFDAVLLDVPCSNTGVLQRRVDARWRLTPEEISRLSRLQSLILEQACATVRPGGRLVYSTCSIDREEDRDVVDAFLHTHPEFTLVRDYTALPHREKADGAYAALLLRQE